MQVLCPPHTKLNNPCSFRWIFKTNWFSVLNSKSVLLTKVAFSPASCLIMSKSFRLQDLNLSPIKSEQCDQACVPQTVWQSIISYVWILWSIVQLLCVNTVKCSTFFLWKHVRNPQQAHPGNEQLWTTRHDNDFRPRGKNSDLGARADSDTLLST